MKLSRNANPNEVQVLEEQIESAQANMDYIQVVLKSLYFILCR